MIVRDAEGQPIWGNLHSLALGALNEAKDTPSVSEVAQLLKSLALPRGHFLARVLLVSFLIIFSRRLDLL